MKKSILIVSALLASSVSFSLNRAVCEDYAFDYLANQNGPLYKTIIQLQAEAQKQESAGNKAEEMKYRAQYIKIQDLMHQLTQENCKL